MIGPLLVNGHRMVGALAVSGSSVLLCHQHRSVVTARLAEKYDILSR